MATWSEDVNPAPPPRPDADFFGSTTSPEDVLVAEINHAPVGYIKIVPGYRGLRAAEHVQRIQGLAVAPHAQGRGLGHRLVQAAAATARDRGARRLTLNVLAPNRAARRLYERCGFVVEGTLHAEFHLRGRYVDDILLALDLLGSGDEAGGPAQPFAVARPHR